MTLKVEYKTLSSADATNQYVSLTGTPVDSTVALDLISGTAQAFGTDFTVDGTKVKWDISPSLTDTTTGLVIGDELRVIYDRS